MSRDARYLVRAGRPTCFDRVVFDVNGPAPAGFAVRYVARGRGHRRSAAPSAAPRRNRQLSVQHPPSRPLTPCLRACCQTDAMRAKHGSPSLYRPHAPMPTNG
ncbi:AMIN-like domain-containing (lipo)protein [Amycolatopsis eburnea]